MADKINPHIGKFEWSEGAAFLTIECPDEDLGDKRPCAPWGSDYDDGTRLNDCVLRQYNEALGPEDFLHGSVTTTVLIAGVGYGEDFHGEVV